MSLINLRDEMRCIRPLKVMRAWMCLVAVMVSGCFVPVDFTTGQSAFSDSGVAFDGGRNPRAAACEVPEVLYADAPPPEPLSIELSGCAGARVEVRSPNGDVLVATTGAHFDFSPPSAGVYVVVTIGDESRRSAIIVDEVLPADAGFERRYVDRLDNCELTTTSRQTVLCLRYADALVSVYDQDGGLTTRLPAIRMRVVGDEVWLVKSQGVIQHFTDTGYGLRLDGEVFSELIPGFEEGVSHFSATMPNSFISVSDTGFVDVRSEGGTLKLTEHARWDLRQTRFVHQDVDDQFYNLSLCTIEIGCQSTLCAPVAVCSLSGSLLGLENEFVWTLDEPSPWSGSRRTISARNRPLSTSTPSGTRPIPERCTSWERRDSAYGLHIDCPEQLFPRKVGQFIQFRSVPSGVVATRDWIVALPHPQVVRFIAR
jgi:hypothetical protein